MPAVDLECRYDRRVDEAFVELFEPDGPFEIVTEYVQKARYPLDLQFRGNYKTSARFASVYVGLSTVLDIHWQHGAIRLVAHEKYANAAHGFDPTWKTWTTLDAAKDWTEAVGMYLDLVIPFAAGTRAVKEGAVQAAVSSFGSPHGGTLDREVMLYFRDLATKQRVMAQVTAGLLDRLQTIQGMGTPPASLGGKCDLLAVESPGRIMAIEVKPRNVSTIVWAPAQVIVYARLLSRWIDTDDQAVTILNESIRQRQRLGLLGSSITPLAQRPQVLPVLAVQRGMSPLLRQRMFSVRDHLASSGIAEAQLLEVHEVNLAGRMTRIDG